MSGLPKPDNPYTAPNSDQFNSGNSAAVLITLSLYCGWLTALAIIGYALLGIVANGYEMTVEFSEWRLREEIFLGALFAFGAFLCFLMRRAHQNRSAKRCFYVGVLSFPSLAYIVFYNLF